MHKQSEKCLFSSLNHILFGSFWPGPNNVVTVLYCHGDKSQNRDRDSIKLSRWHLRHIVWLSWPFALLHTHATIIKEVGSIQFWHHRWTTETMKMWTLGTFPTSYISHTDSLKIIHNSWQFFFFQRGPVVDLLLVSLCSFKMKSSSCSFSRHSSVAIRESQLICRGRLKNTLACVYVSGPVCFYSVSLMWNTERGQIDINETQPCLKLLFMYPLTENFHPFLM